MSEEKEIWCNLRVLNSSALALVTTLRMVSQFVPCPITKIHGACNVARSFCVRWLLAWKFILEKEFQECFQQWRVLLKMTAVMGNEGSKRFIHRTVINLSHLMYVWAVISFIFICLFLFYSSHLNRFFCREIRNISFLVSGFWRSFLLDRQTGYANWICKFQSKFKHDKLMHIIWNRKHIFIS